MLKHPHTGVGGAQVNPNSNSFADDMFDFFLSSCIQQAKEKNKITTMY